jgi:Glucodextranase, domain N
MTRTRSARRESPRGDRSGDARAPQAMAGGAAIPWRYPDRPRLAPGTPGAEPHWAPPAKDDVGMALGPGGYPANRVWFTIGLYVVLAPHLGNRGAGNTAWLGEHRGTPMLFAKRAGRALALPCSAGSKAQPATWACRTAGKILRGTSESNANMIVQMTGTWHSCARSISAPAAEVASPAVIRWTVDGWQTSRESKTHDAGLGMHVVDLMTQDIRSIGAVKWTFYWPGVDRWEGTNSS